jgi:hypothetical protein
MNLEVILPFVTLAIVFIVGAVIIMAISDSSTDNLILGLKKRKLPK